MDNKYSVLQKNTALPNIRCANVQWLNKNYVKLTKVPSESGKKLVLNMHKLALNLLYLSYELQKVKHPVNVDLHCSIVDSHDIDV